MEEVIYEMNASQTEAIRQVDGVVLVFEKRAKPTCEGCEIKLQSFPEGLPCSAGTRLDKQQGIWRRK